MDIEEFKARVVTLVDEYKNSSGYKPPVERHQHLYWFFVGWWALSFGFHISLKHLNVEIHLPFGFITISLKGKKHTRYTAVIQV